MSLRRYVGRATGQHRRKKNHVVLWAIVTGTAICGAVMVGILILNPGGHRPSPEGSATESVTPTGTPTHTPTPSGHPGTA